MAKTLGQLLREILFKVDFNLSHDLGHVVDSEELVRALVWEDLRLNLYSIVLDSIEAGVLVLTLSCPSGRIHGRAFNARTTQI